MLCGSRSCATATIVTMNIFTRNGGGWLEVIVDEVVEMGLEVRFWVSTLSG